MFSGLFGPEARRKRLLRQASQGPLREYLSVPFPDSKAGITDVPIVSLDFETTGLDARKDRILSIGHVDIEGGAIKLNTAIHTIVKSDAALTEESVVIHRITDDAAAFGRTLEEAIAELLQSLTGKVLLAHNAVIERKFLQAACQRLYGLAPVMPMIDTLQLARRWYARRNKDISQGALRLYALREQYGLPRYNAHNALSDALATAELFLAQVERMDNRTPPTLGSLMVR